MNKSISNHIFVTISIHFHDAKKKSILNVNRNNSF